MMRIARLLVPLLSASVGPASAQPAAESSVFRSIELRGGGSVTVRHGDAHRVTVIEGGTNRPIRTDGDRLVIDECSSDCRGGHRIRVEIVAPEIARLAVANGGRIELRGDFPSQSTVAASVSSGGMIDLRPLEAEQASASIDQGGRILVHARSALSASVSNGGNVTYWGDPSILSSIRLGGVVEQGVSSDLARPMAEFDPQPPPLPALPSIKLPRRGGGH